MAKEFTPDEQKENLRTAIARAKSTLDERRDNGDEKGAELAEGALNGYLESYGDILASLGERALSEAPDSSR